MAFAEIHDAACIDEDRRFLLRELGGFLHRDYFAARERGRGFDIPGREQAAGNEKCERGATRGENSYCHDSSPFVSQFLPAACMCFYTQREGQAQFLLL